MPDIEGPGAITKHYNLLTAVMRIICATVLSRGSQNQQTIEQGRRFLSENRLSILAVLKKSAGLGDTHKVPDQSIQDLADAFMLLISVTGFLDVSILIHLQIAQCRTNLAYFSSRTNQISRRRRQRTLPHSLEVRAYVRI